MDAELSRATGAEIPVRWMDSPQYSLTSNALRKDAPSPVARRWRRLLEAGEDAVDRLPQWQAFAEFIARFTVVLLRTELVAQHWEEPPASVALVKKLDSGESPTFGAWAEAAVELARVVALHEDALLRDLAGIFAASTGTTVAAPTSAAAALRELVAIRNAVSHGREGTELGLDRSEPHMGVLLGALRQLGRLRLWVVVHESTANGTGTLRVWPARGQDRQPSQEVQTSLRVDTRAPFVIAPDGRLLYLLPALAFGRFTAAAGHGGEELRVLTEWKNGPRYDDPEGKDSTPRQLRGGENKATSLSAAWSLAAKDAFFPADPGRAEFAAQLLGATSRQELPLVPGYDLEAPLGRGGNARVFLARRREDGERVAVKVLAEALASDVTAEGRFRREFELMRKVHHANVVKVFETLELPHGGHAIVLEYVEGQTLRARVQQARPPLPEVLRVVKEVLRGLACVHALGVVHRDVSPENVMVDTHGNVKLLDFGIARGPESVQLTRTLDGLGKVDFSAPEQRTHADRVDARADVFSCGRLLSFLASAQSDPEQQVRDLPGALVAIVRRATQEDREARYPDVVAMLQALEAVERSGLEGPPVWPGAKLTPELTVESVLRRGSEGLWFVRLARKNGRNVLAVVAELRDAAEAALSAEIEQMSDADRARLGTLAVAYGSAPRVAYVPLNVAEVSDVGGPFGTPVLMTHPSVKPLAAAPVAAPSVAVSVELDDDGWGESEEDGEACVRSAPLASPAKRRSAATTSLPPAVAPPPPARTISRDALTPQASAPSPPPPTRTISKDAVASQTSTPSSPPPRSAPSSRPASDVGAKPSATSAPRVAKAPASTPREPAPATPRTGMPSRTRKRKVTFLGLGLRLSAVAAFFVMLLFPPLWPVLILCLLFLFGLLLMQIGASRGKSR